jgi:glycosyltransferase involved in cell wall biosynthesis
MDRLVSVVIPTKNRAELLRCSLRSALTQTGPAIEIVVVDDGSTDGTAAMLARDFPLVRTVRIDGPGGPSRARNVGVARSTGQWILFLDDDDLLHPEHVESLVRAAKGLPRKSVVFGRWRRFVQSGDLIGLGPSVCPPLSPSPYATIAELLSPSGEGTTWTSAGLWPRAVFDDVAWDETLTTNGDVDFVGRAMLAGYRIAGRRVGMAYYRMHDGPRVSGADGVRSGGLRPDTIPHCSSLLSSASYRLKWSRLLRNHPQRSIWAPAMRDGFMSLLLSLVWLPPADPMLARLREAYREWGGGSFYMTAPPRSRWKRAVAYCALRIGGPRLLSAALAFFPQSPHRSSLFAAIGPDAGIDCATIRRLSKLAKKPVSTLQFVPTEGGKEVPAAI